MRSTYTPPLLADPAFLVSAGMVGGASTVNKFGRAPSGVQTTATDIWDRADATPTQQIWTAPTAGTYTIASTDADDTDGGAGARTVEVYGLTAWNADETSETVTMNTASPPVTSASYVIIHRMVVRTAGGSATNEGTITATTNGAGGAISAQINAGEGQTQMAIYGVPSTKIAYVTKYYGSVNKAQGAAASINLSLVVAEDANTDVDFFVVKHTLGMQSTGASEIEHGFNPYFKVAGPAIIKMQGIASAADVEASAGFDIILVDA